MLLGTFLKDILKEFLEEVLEEFLGKSLTKFWERISKYLVSLEIPTGILVKDRWEKPGVVKSLQKDARTCGGTFLNILTILY